MNLFLYSKYLNLYQHHCPWCYSFIFNQNHVMQFFSFASLFRSFGYFRYFDFWYKL